MFNIIKVAFPQAKFESLPISIIRNASDYIINIPRELPLVKENLLIRTDKKIPISTKSLLAVVEKVSPSSTTTDSIKKEINTVSNSSINYHTRISPSFKKREIYEFIDEDETAGEKSVPEAKLLKKHTICPLPEVREQKIILKRPSLESVPEKSQISGPVNEESLLAEPTNPLQLLLALNDPDLMLMNTGQWSSYIHKYVTDEYVYIGQTKSMPFYRKRKQLMQDLEALERSKGAKLIEFDTVLNYLAWKYDIHILAHKHISQHKTKSLCAYPEMHLWRRATPIYCVGSAFVSGLKFSQLRDYLEASEDNGILIEWPQADGKKTDLLAELGGEGAASAQLSHLKKDELSRLVGKKRVYDLFGH